MNLLEYQSHELFRSYGLPALEGQLIDSVEGINQAVLALENFPMVFKAQVQTGGRGKSGGIRIVHSLTEAVEAGTAIFGLSIGGLTVEQILIAPAISILKELYISLVLDRNSHRIVLLFSEEGGVDINETAEKDSSKIIKFEMHPWQKIQPYMARYIVSRMNYQIDPNKLMTIMESLYNILCEQHCLLVEVNPLVITPDGRFKLLDGKVVIDDNALEKLPEFLAIRNGSEKDPRVSWAREKRLLFIPIDEDQGSIGIISNGSGMIMSSIDLITQAGCKVRSALDLGGGATAQRVSQAVQIVLSDSKVKLLFINIFGGITRCDEIVAGVLAAYKEQTNTVPLVLRLEGTNKELGLSLLKTGMKTSCRIADDLNHGVLLIVDLVEKTEVCDEHIG